MTPFDDNLQKSLTPPKMVGYGSIAILVLAFAGVYYFASQGRVIEAVLVTSGALCVLVLGLMDFLGAIILLLRRIVTVLEDDAK